MMRRPAGSRQAGCTWREVGWEAKSRRHALVLTALFCCCPCNMHQATSSPKAHSAQRLPPWEDQGATGSSVIAHFAWQVVWVTELALAAALVLADARRVTSGHASQKSGAHSCQEVPWHAYHAAHCREMEQCSHGPGAPQGASLRGGSSGGGGAQDTDSDAPAAWQLTAKRWEPNRAAALPPVRAAEIPLAVRRSPAAARVMERSVVISRVAIGAGRFGRRAQDLSSASAFAFALLCTRIPAAGLALRLAHTNCVNTPHVEAPDALQVKLVHLRNRHHCPHTDAGRRTPQHVGHSTAMGCTCAVPMPRCARLLMLRRATHALPHCIGHAVPCCACCIVPLTLCRPPAPPIGRCDTRPTSRCSCPPL